MLIKDFLWAHDPTRDFVHFIKKILHNDYKEKSRAFVLCNVSLLLTQNLLIICNVIVRN